MSTLSQQFALVKNASRSLALLSEDQIKDVLFDLADALIKNQTALLEANKKDLARMESADPKYDRLLLSEARLLDMAKDIKTVAHLHSPVGEILEERTLPNGLELKRIRVPLGVIGVIYEARPNVTTDVFSLCFKSRNACILKGGSDADESNKAIALVIQKVLQVHKIDQNILFLMPSPREFLQELLTAREFVDVIIPRGSQSLITFVVENASVPVIETGAGIVHTYFDKSGDLAIAPKIIENAKTRRPSVCNALDTLIVHQSRLADLPTLVAPLAASKVQIYADEPAFAALKNSYPHLEPARPDHFGIEFLSLRMSIKTVASLEEALEHIRTHGSRHSEAIIAEDEAAIEKFLNEVDAAVVYSNTETGFTDGAQFGLGAEIGISTQKLHARGPMALPELTSYKWQVRGHGQIRQ